MPESVPCNSIDAPLPRRWLRALRVMLVVIGTSFSGCMVWAGYHAFFGIEATSSRTERLLRSKALSHFELREASLNEAVDLFRRALIESGINEGKIHVRLMDSAMPADEEHIQRRRSVLLRNIPLYEAGEYLVALFDLEMSINGEEVRIQAESKEPFLRRFPTTPGFVSGRLSRKADGSYDIEEFLKTQGIRFQDGTWATADPVTGELVVFLPKGEMALVEVIFDPWCARPLTWRERMGGWKETVQGWLGL